MVVILLRALFQVVESNKHRLGNSLSVDDSHLGIFARKLRCGKFLKERRYKPGISRCIYDPKDVARPPLLRRQLRGANFILGKPPIYLRRYPSPEGDGHRRRKQCALPQSLKDGKLFLLQGWRDKPFQIANA